MKTIKKARVKNFKEFGIPVKSKLKCDLITGLNSLEFRS